MNKTDKIPTNRRSPAATLAYLAHEAWDGHSALIVHGGIRGSGPSEHRASILRFFWKQRRPGAFIEQQSPEVRQRLRELRSDDIANVGAFPDWYAADESPVGRVWKLPGSRDRSGGTYNDAY